MASTDFARVVGSLVASELAAARRTSVLMEPLASISGATTLGEDGLQVDSLELMRLVSALTELFHLHETNAGDYLLQRRSVGQWAEIVKAAWELDHERLTFRTSGSSGEPKRCTHEFTALQREVSGHAAEFADVKRVLAAVPSHHIYGFIFTVLLPAQLACDVIDVRTWAPGRIVRELRDGDLLVASPTFWEYLSRAVERFAISFQGVTSTAPCPDALFERLFAQGVKLMEIYGASETAGIGGRRLARAPFELLPDWTREGEKLVRENAAGGSGERASFEPADDLEWAGERTFFVRARRDGAVQVGGTNVFPNRIAARIAAHPSVSECAVRLMKPEEGDRLKAFVVWRDGASGDGEVEALRQWLREELTTSERPVVLTFGAALPRNELGKLADWAV